MKKYFLLLVICFSFAGISPGQIAAPHNGQASGKHGKSEAKEQEEADDVVSDKDEAPKNDSAASKNDSLAPKVQQVYKDTAYHGDSSEIFNAVEEMPSFPEDSMNQFLMHHLHFGIGDFDASPSPKPVYVAFIVEKDGSVSNAIIRKGSGYPKVDEMVLGSVQMMPKCKPGEMSGRTVRTRMIIPVKICLQ